MALSAIWGKIGLSGEKEINIWGKAASVCPIFLFYVQGKLLVINLVPRLHHYEKSVDPDQLASEEASWSGFTLF